MKKILFAIVSVMAAAGCTREAEPQDYTGASSDFLVISADCQPMTKTDMNEGKSTWDAGDKITVVYEGAAYEYVAASSGETTTFTSTAGITGYDASKPVVAYYPATDASGVVKIEAEKAVEFTGNSQVNKSCAPLVGVPQDGNLSDGKLNMSFSNIFSVLELRIDSGELEGVAKSLTIEPADATDFTGYLAVTGTVDPATLAVTSSATSSSMKLVLPASADPKKAMTLKVPVGRFATGSGLKVTLETSEGSFSKLVYKNGLTSYEEKDGKFVSKHFAKPMYAFAPVGGGIKTAADLVAFAAAVNAGESLAPWMDAKGVVVLENDIDMSSVTEWTPIGASAFTWASNKLTCNSGNMFTGHFDGQGHSIRNLKMVCTNSTAGAAYGLFGAIAEGAVVENIVFDSSCSLELKSTVATDCGVVAGLVWDARVINVTNNASMSFTGTSDNKKVTMAVVGMTFAQNDSAVVRKVVNNGKVSAVDGGTTENGGNAVQVAGILGFGTNHASSDNISAVVDCLNNGDIESATARASGIVAACNRYTHIRRCSNYGDNTNTFNKKTEGDGAASRIGNITCITGAGSSLYDCVNYGDVISTTKGAVAGVISLVNGDDNVFENVATYGRVITDRTLKKYCGVFFGQCNKKAAFTGCISGGSFGTYNNGDYQIAEVTAENYWDYVGAVGTNGVNATKENIRFGVRPN